MDQFLPGGGDEGEDLLRQMISPEGTIVRETILVNPRTGEVCRIAEVTDVRYNPETGKSESHTQVIPLIGGDGTVIEDPREFVICGEGGEPCSRSYSVVDPFCGRILCLMHSQMVDVDGVPYRVCATCAKAIKWAKTKKAIVAFFFGRRK